MMDNQNCGFSNSFLEIALRDLVLSSSKSEQERKQVQTIISICEKNGLSFRVYMQTLNEINAALLELQREEADDEQR